eukprot:9478563-Pyramimonas_sp.AAC.1
MGRGEAISIAGIARALHIALIARVVIAIFLARTRPPAAAVTAATAAEHGVGRRGERRGRVLSGRQRVRR